jgi:thioredoxin
MKKAIYILMALLTAGIVNAQNNEKATTKLSQYVARPGAVISMDEEMFAEKIYNEAESPNEWKYLGDKPCIIDFYTTWCGPCKRLAPVLETIAEKYDGLIRIYRIDAEKELKISRKFGIRSYPTLLFCPMNDKPQMAIGALPKNDIEKLIANILLK